MCGRTACTLQPDEICKSCIYQNKSGEWTKPKWRDPPGGQKYYTSYNVCPSNHTPVLMSSRHVSSGIDPEESNTERIVQPMQWGLVPSWHSGDPKKVPFSNNNARSDGLLQKNTFRKPLEAGRRCVVLADGYFEWHTKDGVKQPYFIYFPQGEEKKVEGTGTKKLLTMAGLFDVWNSKETGDPLYSYSIITVDAHEKVNWIHHRMPAILNGEEEISKWLNYGEVPLKEAVQLIRPVDCLSYHPVSSAVNNSSTKTEDCVKPYDLEKAKQKTKQSAGFMKAWLTGANKRKTDEQAEPEKKQRKIE